jgi:RNA polymerase sigma-70 factor (ECF subfamily)
MGTFPAIAMADLLAAARTGDGAARSCLLAECRRWLAPQAGQALDRRLQPKVDASDLLQQTMLDVHRNLRDFRGQTEAEWQAWLRQVLDHNAANYARHYRGTAKRQQQREVALVGGASATGDFPRRPAAIDPSDHAPRPSQAAQQHERHAQLVAALGELSEDHRQVIVLRQFERLAFDEIAERMERTRPAVQMLWMRALAKLQILLNEHSCA